MESKEDKKARLLLGSVLVPVVIGIHVRTRPRDLLRTHTQLLMELDYLEPCLHYAL